MKVTKEYKLRNGDVVICSGSGIISRLIRFVSFGMASHVGMIVVDFTDLPHIYHSTMMNGNKTGKVSLQDWDDFLNRYKGKVFIRSLYSQGEVVTLTIGPPRHFRYETQRFIKGTKGLLYEQNKLELLGSAMPWKNKSDLSSLFCSELIVLFFMSYLNCIRNGTPANEYTPNDFLPGRMVDKKMKKHKLGPLVRVK